MVRFQLNIEAAPGDEAWLVEGGSRQRVSVEEEFSTNTYRVKISSTNTSQIAPKEMVEKIGGNIPLNTVCFDDGADVFQSVQLQYSNCARTEEIANIAPQHRRRPEFCALLGTTAGGETHRNTHERTVSTMHICACTGTWTCSCTRTCTWTRTCTGIYACTCTCICTCTRTCTCTVVPRTTVSTVLGRR